MQNLWSGIADAIGEHAAKFYFPHFATILHLLPVQVRREQKFTGS